MLYSHLLLMHRYASDDLLHAQHVMYRPAMTDAPSSEQVAAWRLLLETHARVVERVEAALAERGLPPLAWYDVLWALREAPGGRLRQTEIAHAVVMSRSGLSRLIDRIEEAGLLRRQAAPSDRRAVEVVLTPQGRAMLRRMWAVYGDGIARGFARSLDDPAALTRALEPVVAALRAEPQPAR
jgi:DNA-binding MarR family transcriptional regulator